jgi:hypothetical protein
MMVTCGVTILRLWEIGKPELPSPLEVVYRVLENGTQRWLPTVSRSHEDGA